MDFLAATQKSLLIWTFHFNTYSRKLKNGTVCCKNWCLSLFVMGGCKDPMQCFSLTVLHTARSMEKRTCYKTETLWVNRNNMVAETKPSNSMCNGIAGSLWVTVTLADSRYINQQSFRVKHECRKKGDRSPRDYRFFCSDGWSLAVSAPLALKVGLLQVVRPSPLAAVQLHSRWLDWGGKMSVGHGSPKREYKCSGKYVSWFL